MDGLLYLQYVACRYRNIVIVSNYRWSALLSPRKMLFKFLPGLCSSSSPRAFLLPIFSRSASLSAQIDSTWLASWSAPDRYWSTLCKPSAKVSMAGSKFEITLLTRVPIAVRALVLDLSDSMIRASLSSRNLALWSPLLSWTGCRLGIDGGRRRSSRDSFSDRNLIKKLALVN